ncbi:MAG: DNA gyrase/topoisomerase IV subunit A [Bacteroidales bacterium]|nr:DNA gyrase/topoisomerase IV subunit A [Bacteroidales bacterium]
MDIEDKTELENEDTLDEQPVDETLEGVEDAQAQEDEYHVIPLKGMFENWFLDYASYVILERAVPAIEDGLKPVQRRILHSMDELDDGRFNKVANIVGNTMKYHPHGDASIGDALVQLAQKDLLMDTQGNFGNILTGDDAAAPRYIEARLSKFAKEVVFNHKTTDWTRSYDNRNAEPVSLPVKFPLLLAQGTEGIAVGLASKFLPHNFNELIDASVAYLKDEPFTLYPDFPTGGLMDVTNYNDGKRGGKVRIRAKISQQDKKTLVISEIPYGTTTGSLIESIVKCNDKGKIKIKKIDDNTAEQCEIVIYLNPGVSPDQTIDALYAFTDCEVSISPNACVIVNQHPAFLGVSEILKLSTDRTMELLSWELRILIEELENSWHWISLEKIFFEKGIYKELESKEYADWDQMYTGIERRFDKYRKLLKREVTREDVEKLCEKPVRKISRFDIKKADEQLADIEKKMEEAKYNLDHIVDYTIDYFLHIKEKYGEGRGRKTEIRNFDNISAVAVAANNEKLYVNRDEGFVCTGEGLKREKNKEAYEYVCDCSDMDDIIVFHEDGKYAVVKLQPKLFVGQKVIHVDVFHKNDDRTTYNVVYRDGKNGAPHYVKRFAVKGVTRDKEYDLTQGKPGSKVRYFSSNPNGEAEVIKVTLVLFNKKQKTVDYKFADLAVKGRDTRGNLLTKYEVKEIKKGGEGVSTLNARDIWFDDTVRRLNVDKRGQYLGAFEGDDKILQIFSNGEFKISGFDLNTHFDDDMVEIRKFDPDEIFSVIYIEGETQKHYLKRFTIEAETKLNSRASFIGEHPEAKYLGMNTDVMPRLKLSYKVSDAGNSFPDDEVNVEEFIGIKSYKAKGKRLSTREIDTWEFLEPFQPEPSEETPEDTDEIGESAEEETTERINVNPADVPLEIVEPKGDGVQMDLFNELSDGESNNE